jgi:hypothetical protein
MGANEKHIEGLRRVLTKGATGVVGGWSHDDKAALEAGIEALQRDVKLADTNDKLAHLRELLANLNKSSDEYLNTLRLIGELEKSRSGIYRLGAR